MKILIDFIKVQILQLFINIKKKFIVHKYGIKSDVCIITGSKLYLDENKIFKTKCLSFRTSHTGGRVYLLKEKNVCSKIRKFIGENILSLYGLPTETQTFIESPPNVVLIMTPSAFWTLGIFNYFKFKKEWIGESKVGDLVAVTYTLR